MKIRLKFIQADDGYRATFITGGRCGLLLNREREGVVYFNYSDGDGEPVPIPYADRRKNIYIPFNLPSGVWVTVVSKSPVLNAVVSGDAMLYPHVDPNQKSYPNAVQDYDGNWYDAIIIGDQVWLAENLRSKHYTDGTAIPEGGETTSNDTPYYYMPYYSVYNDKKDGLLYNWPAVMHGENSSQENPSGVQGIAPNDWHVPSIAEWTEFTDYISTQSSYIAGGDSDHIAKSLAATYGWTQSNIADSPGNNQSTNNATGFNAIPVGIFPYGSFGLVAAFTSTNIRVNSNDDCICFYVEYNVANSYTRYVYKYNGKSVRCICDKTPAAFAEWYVKTYKTTNHKVQNKYAE